MTMTAGSNDGTALLIIDPQKTDLEVLLKGLRIHTLIVCGFLTDAVSGSSREAHEASLRAGVEAEELPDEDS